MTIIVYSVAMNIMCVQDGNCLWVVVHQAVKSPASLVGLGRYLLASSCLLMKVMMRFAIVTFCCSNKLIRLLWFNFHSCNCNGIRYASLILATAHFVHTEYHISASVKHLITVDYHCMAAQCSQLKGSEHRWANYSLHASQLWNQAEVQPTMQHQRCGRECILPAEIQGDVN